MTDGNDTPKDEYKDSIASLLVLLCYATMQCYNITSYVESSFRTLLGSSTRPEDSISALKELHITVD